MDQPASAATTLSWETGCCQEEKSSVRAEEQKRMDWLGDAYPELAM